MEIQGLGLTLRELLRYGYTGLLCLFLSSLIKPDETGQVVEALGNVLAPLVTIAIGAGIYAFHRTIFNDHLLEPLANWIHRQREPKWGFDPVKKVGYNCAYHLLIDKFHVARQNSINAYRVVRDSNLFEGHVRHRFHVQNSEIHILYLTFTVSLGATLFLVFEQLLSGWWSRVCLTVTLGVVSVISMMIGLLANVAICRQQCAYLLTRDQAQIGELLKSSQLSITKPTSDGDR